MRPRPGAKYYDILCPRCGWHADMVDEYAAAKFRQVNVCQDCLRGQSAHPSATVEFVITEHVTRR